ncbi:MAG: hypothetical protein HC774_05285 [Sphingomonadales bacterium]|nr:hypothetical protein [Sphingomonadales bacterium]
MTFHGRPRYDLDHAHDIHEESDATPNCAAMTFDKLLVAQLVTTAPFRSRKT